MADELSECEKVLLKFLLDIGAANRTQFTETESKQFSELWDACIYMHPGNPLEYAVRLYKICDIAIRG